MQAKVELEAQEAPVDEPVAQSLEAEEKSAVTLVSAVWHHGQEAAAAWEAAPRLVPQ